MSHLEIKIQAVGQPPPFPEFNGAERAELLALALIEKGTALGRTAAGIFVRAPDGKVYCVETTARFIRAMGSAAGGTIQRFEDDDQ